MKEKNKYKFFGIISIGYGILFTLLDRLDCLGQADKYEGISTMSYSEPTMLRMPNLIFSISLILAGYLLINKKKENWYLFNFSFIGILLKYLISFFIAPFAIGNILHFTGVHFLIAVFGLIMVNRSNFLTDFQIKLKERKKSQIYIVLLTSSILFFYGFEKLLHKEINRKKHFQYVIFDSHPFSNKVIDSCYFANDFMNILDTLEEIDNYSQIQILQLDSNSNPVYGEKLSIYEYGTLNDYYIYNDSGLLIRTIQEKESYSGNSDTIIYDYYNNDKIKSKTRIYYYLSTYDTMTYHYNYFKDQDTIYYSDDKVFNYSYASSLNNSNQILETKQVKGIYSSGPIEYKYDSIGQLVKITEYNQNKDTQKSIELFIYDKNGLLARKEKNIYKENSNKLVEKELTMIVYKRKN